MRGSAALLPGSRGGIGSFICLSHLRRLLLADHALDSLRGAGQGSFRRILLYILGGVGASSFALTCSCMRKFAIEFGLTKVLSV